MTDTPGPGHNLPPDPLIAAVEAESDAVTRFLKDHGTLDTWDADTAVRCQALFTDVTKACEALDRRRLQEGRDFKALQDKKYSPPLMLGTAAKAALDRLRKGWLQREQERVQREAAAAAERAKKLADEAAKIVAKAAQNKKDPLGAQLAAQEAEQRAREAQAEAEAAPTRAQIKGGGVRTTSLAVRWDGEITDFKKAYAHYRSHPVVIQAVKDAMQRLAKMEATATKDPNLAPPGVRYFTVVG